MSPVKRRRLFGQLAGLPNRQAFLASVPVLTIEVAVGPGRYRQRFQAQHPRSQETLHWHRPGAVWAINQSQPPRPVDGRYGQILAVRDLASGMQLSWTPVQSATATEALPILEELMRVFGPPMVLKGDNGSAFIATEFASWLTRWQIVPLFSPVRMPRYNGACEAGGAAPRKSRRAMGGSPRMVSQRSLCSTDLSK